MQLSIRESTTDSAKVLSHGSLRYAPRINRLRPSMRRLAALALLLAGIPVLAQQKPFERSEAMQSGRTQAFAKEYDQALAIFGDMVQHNPHDIEARNWIARVESWKGNYARAEHLYLDVLDESPDDVEAQLGLADVLLWKENHRGAAVLLHQMLKRQPDNPEILLRLGRICQREGRRKEALAYYQHVLVFEPENQEARDAVESAGEQKRFRLETGYLREQFNFASDTNGQFLSLLYRKSERLNLIGRFEYQNKFGENDTRFAFGSTYRIRQHTWFHAEISQAPRSNTVIANQTYAADVTRLVVPGVAVGAGYTFLNFRSAQVNAWNASFNWEPRPYFHFYLRYLPTRTQFNERSGNTWTHGGSVRLVWDAHRRFSPYLMAAIGNESFSTLSIDKLGRLTAHIYGGGLELRLTPTKGLHLGYHVERRTENRQEHVLEFSHYFDF